MRVVMVDGSGEGKYSNLLGMFAAGPGDFKPAQIQNSDSAVIMYTSGTTSDPKGVTLTHANLLAEADAVFSFIPVSERDAILGVLPLFHSLAQMANLLLPYAVGARVVYLEETNTTELLRALSERGITLFACVPQFFYLIHERVMQEVKKRPALARAGLSRAMMRISGAGRKAGLNSLGLNLGKLFFRQSSPACWDRRCGISSPADRRSILKLAATCNSSASMYCRRMASRKPAAPPVAPIQSGM